MATHWTIWTPKHWSTPWMTCSKLQAETVHDTLGDLEAAEAQLDTVAEKLAEVEDATPSDALAVALTGKLAKVDTKALVHSVANTLAKVKALTLGDTLRAVQAH